MDFYEQVGTAALGSRLRRLNDLMTSQAAEVYRSYHVAFEPRWFPVFYMVASVPVGISATLQKALARRMLP